MFRIFRHCRNFRGEIPILQIGILDLTFLQISAAAFSVYNTGSASLTSSGVTSIPNAPSPLPSPQQQPEPEAAIFTFADNSGLTNGTTQSVSLTGTGVAAALKRGSL
jgi:hypothetical protein